MIIRPEHPADAERIFALTTDAFAPKAFSDGTEAAIIGRLRDAGDLTLSLVAVKDDCIIGHVAFSPVTIDGDHAGWFGLGPVSVELNHQRQGVGSGLINQGLDTIRSRDATGCVLIGDPNYYSRFGFRSDGNLAYGDLSTAYVQWLAFKDMPAKGQLKFAPAFEGTNP